jgi:hypothetical protein
MSRNVAFVPIPGSKFLSPTEAMGSTGMTGPQGIWATH